MARKFEPVPGRYAWHFDLCEERFLIGTLEKIKPNLAADNNRWMLDFEQKYYHEGLGVTESFLASLAIHCNRLNIRTIIPVETDASEYVRSHDRSLKAKTRQDIRDQYLDLSPSQRTDWLSRAEFEIAALPPPHFTFEQFQSRRAYYNSQTGPVLSTVERDRRRTAVTDAETKPEPVTLRLSLPAKPASKLSRVARQLQLTGKLADPENARKTLIATIDPDEALDLAEQVEDQTIQEMLFYRSIATTDS